MRVPVIPILMIPALLALGGLGCRSRTAGEAPAQVQGLRVAGLRGLSFQVAPPPEAAGYWFPGEAMGDESSQVIISAPVRGLVEAVPAMSGRPLGRGQALVVLRSPELAELQARWIQATARLKRAEADLGREERLARAQAGAGRDLELAQAERAMAEAEARSARLALEARGVKPEGGDARLTLFAPAAGTLVEWKVQLGQGVEAGQALGVFQAKAATLARVELPPPAPGWKLGDPVEVRGDGRTWSATVTGLPANMNESTHRLIYRLRLGGGALPLPGTPLEVRVPLGRAVALPLAALQEVEGVWGVFVEEGGMARFVPVVRGPELEGRALLTGGLKGGERVVTEGAFLLKSMTLKQRSGGDRGEA